MSEPGETVRINVLVDISGSALQTIVQTVKEIAGRDATGVYRVDTADKVGGMITRFLEEKNFDAYVADKDNYSR